MALRQFRCIDNVSYSNSVFLFSIVDNKMNITYKFIFANYKIHEYLFYVQLEKVQEFLFIHIIYY